MARVSLYLNFPNYTYEAFCFYKSVFETEFTDVNTFNDVPPADDMPPFSEEEKKLIMHIELPILNGLILMGTDAPESMGFKVNFGNNIHINLEPDTKEEGKILFDKLSEGGNITMPLQDMFWGAYFGSLTDKYGVQWMINVANQSV